MLSKPKTGLYIKHRDQGQRRSPRVSDENEDNLLALEVEVENYGEGNIQADKSPQWPQKNFEEDEVDGPKEDENNLPAQAKKYIVHSNSLKDLTGAKFITVPESKITPSEKSSTPKQPGSVRLYSHGGLTGRQYLSSTSGTIQQAPQIEGTFRGYPVNYIPDGGQRSARHFSSRSNQLGTGHMTLRSFRVPSSRHMSTVRVIPSKSTAPRGYHLASNATVRSHNTGQAVHQLLQHKLAGWDNPVGTVAFHRSNTLAEKKEYSFNQFGIELDRGDQETYFPGETMSGRIIIEVGKKVEIRFVELLIIGLGSVQFSKTDPNNPTTARQIVFSKRSYVMGTPDGRWNSVITPGKYVSRFRFVLPDGIPSSLKYVDQKNGFSFEVGYIVKCRICDEVGSSSARSTHSTNNFVKVLLTRRYPFNVRRPFDVHAIPKALLPLEHSEFVNISCIPTTGDAAMVTLSLDRSVFLAGDEIRVRMTAPHKTSKKIKTLNCELQQRLKTTLKPYVSYTVGQIFEKNPTGTLAKHKSTSTVIYEFIIPTRTDSIPSFLSGCSIISATYAIVMCINFKSCNGTLVLEVPIGLGPCADPANPDTANTVPLFNRPKRFPNFSDAQDGDIPHKNLQNGNLLQSHTVERQTNEPEILTVHI